MSFRIFDMSFDDEDDIIMPMPDEMMTEEPKEKYWVWSHYDAERANV